MTQTLQRHHRQGLRILHDPSPQSGPNHFGDPSPSKQTKRPSRRTPAHLPHAVSLDLHRNGQSARVLYAEHRLRAAVTNGLLADPPTIDHAVLRYFCFDPDVPIVVLALVDTGPTLAAAIAQPSTGVRRDPCLIRSRSCGSRRTRRTGGSPSPRLHVGAADSLSECAFTNVASRSIYNRCLARVVINCCPFHSEDSGMQNGRPTSAS